MNKTESCRTEICPPSAEELFARTSLRFDLERIFGQQNVDSERQQKLIEALTVIQHLGRSYSWGALEITKVFSDKIRVEVDGEECLFALTLKKFEGDALKKRYLVKQRMVNGGEGGSCVVSDYLGAPNEDGYCRFVQTKNYACKRQTGEVEATSFNIPYELFVESDIALFDTMRDFFTLLQNQKTDQ